MCGFVSNSIEIVTFLRKNGDLPKQVVDFPRERDTFRNKIMEIIEDFACEDKTLSILREFRIFLLFLQVSFFFYFLHFFNVFSSFSTIIIFHFFHSLSFLDFRHV